MHQVMVTLRAKFDPEMIGRRGASGRAYRTCSVIVFCLWTLTRVNQTLAGRASGRIVVHPVSVLKQGGEQVIRLHVGASGHGPMRLIVCCQVRKRVSRWWQRLFQMTSATWRRYIDWTQQPNAATGRPQTNRAIRAKEGVSAR